jgi:hypothetical protein
MFGARPSVVQAKNGISHCGIPHFPLGARSPPFSSRVNLPGFGLLAKHSLGVARAGFIRSIALRPVRTINLEAMSVLRNVRTLPARQTLTVFFKGDFSNRVRVGKDGGKAPLKIRYTMGCASRPGELHIKAN